MIEEFIDAFAIGTLGCCRHAMPEFRFEIIKDPLVGICGCPVHFYEDHEVHTIIEALTQKCPLDKEPKGHLIMQVSFLKIWKP